MNTMKQINLVFALAMSILLANSAWAYGPKHGKDHYPLMRMSEELNLTEEQINSLKGLVEERPEHDRRAQHKAMQALFELDPNSAEYQAELDRLAEENAQRARAATYHRAEMRAKITAILTTEQQAKLKELKAQKKDRKHKFH